MTALLKLRDFPQDCPSGSRAVTHDKSRDVIQLRGAAQEAVHRVQNDLLLLAKRGISMVVPYHLRISGSTVFPRSLNEYLPCQNKVGSAKDFSWILTFAQFFCWNNPCRTAKVVFY